MRWLITSDWQTKFSTLDASKRAHEQELSLIEKHKLGGHIDLGDLKDDFNPVDINVVQFQQTRKAAIHKAVNGNDITLMGNHDMLAQTSEGKNWFSLFNSISGYNVSKATTIRIGNCLFSCLPFRRDKKEILANADALDKEQKRIKGVDRRILLFHCSVNGASWNKLSSKKDESKVTLKGLHTTKYDMCFGGHIHMYQKLSDNCMYVGNPYCNDAGEINQQKGFIIYDDETNSYKRIRSNVPGLYSWDYVRANSKRLTLVDGSKIKATVECEASSNYHRELDKVASAIEHKYPDCISYVVPSFRTEQNGESVEIDPDSSDYDKIAQYIKATVPEELYKKRKALIRYVASTLSSATTSGVRQAGKLTFEDVSANNVLTFEKVNFSFRNRGITLIKGKNKDAIWNSNGAGKSNLLSLLPIAISGITFKEQKNDSWANDSNKTKAVVRLNMLDERKRQLSIIRQRRPTKLKFLINGVDESIGRRHIGKKETQGRIEETIGYTFDTLSNSVYIDSSISNAFLTGTPADRAKLIHQFQNMDRFKVAKDRIGKELSALSKTQQEAINQKEIAVEILAQLEKDIIKAIKHKKNNLKELKEKRLDARTNLATIKKSLKQLSHTHKVLSDRVAKKTEGLISSIQAKTKEANVITAAIDAKDEEHQTFAELGKLKKCPQCAQDLTDAHKKVVLARIKKAASAKRTELKKLHTALASQRTELNNLTAPIANLDTEVNKVEELLSQAKYRYEQASFAYDKGKTSSNEEQADVRDLKKRRSVLYNTIKRTKRILKHHNGDSKFLKFAQETMSRDGLPSFLNKLLCPLLNKAAAKYADVFTDKEIQVLFDIEDGHITPSVINLHGGKSKQAQSMGEKAWAGLITAFALREIAQPTNLLILDEPGNGLDSEGAKLFGNRINRLKDRFESILIVSHNEHIINALEGDNSVTVVKKNKISTVK